LEQTELVVRNAVNPLEIPYHGFNFFDIIIHLLRAIIRSAAVSFPDTYQGDGIDMSKVS
jgi:hypothetical protein